MSFYKYILCIMTFLMNFDELSSAGNKQLSVSKMGVEGLSPCSVGLVFFADVNNTSDQDFDVEITPDQCCLELNSEENCDVVQLIGDCVETVPKGTTKTLRMVAPLTDPFERKGYCIVHLDSKPKNTQRGTMRDSIKIPFDTRVKHAKKLMNLPNNVIECNRIDEDPLNDCKPVDCETYYNGKRSYYDSKAKRCIDVPSCVPETEDEVPDAVLDLNKNRCIFGNSVSNNDLNTIKELTVNKDRKPKHLILIQNVKKHKNPNQIFNSTVLRINGTQKPMYKVSQIAEQSAEERNALLFHRDMVSKKIDEIKGAGKLYLISDYFIANRWTILVLGGIILVQSCLICTMMYCWKGSCTRCPEKKVTRKFFNYRQDASVTTPLICTSNIDTDTTEFQYFSESSNIDKKIKCYKACQKERKNNVKMSMSDDILSKCLTRRDWNSKPAKSDAIPEVPVTEIEETKDEPVDSFYRQSVYQKPSSQFRKQSSTRVNFENEKSEKFKPDIKHRIVKSIVKRFDSRHRERKGENDYDEMGGEQSEKEIKCHSYNYVDGNSNVSGFKPGSQTKRLGIFRSDKSKKTAPSIERGAQAAFSNDSIDDFLSERGLIFLAGENLSKYSFSSRSNEGKASSVSSGVSSKTSKNNMVKNVLSLLHRKSRHGPSSDPGVNKLDDTNIDVELLHMSHASVYSSNNDSDYLKSMKMAKDSRSSL